MSEGHNNAILQNGYNFAEKYLKLHRKLGTKAKNLTPYPVCRLSFWRRRISWRMTYWNKIGYFRVGTNQQSS